MANVVVVGAQWGDEGKGKIVDWLSERADVIARFQGGHNAGHTLVIEGKVYKLSLLPSGIVRGGKLSVIGNGVVVDPWHLVMEIEKLRGQGVDITPENLMVAENASLILPIHGELDRARENQNSVAKIGTTGRGIGPAYEDKVGRRAIRVADLADEATLVARVDRLMGHHDALRRGLGVEPVDKDALLAALRAMPGLKAWDSDANMILVRVTADEGDADAASRVFERLKAGGVLVKNVSKMHPLLANCLRLTVGTEAENTQLLASLEKAL